MWKNGTQVIDGVGSGEPFTKLMIGAGSTGIVPNPWHGAIHEVVVFDKELGDSAITDIEYTLRQKWGF
jgi:hypothetical protein